MRTVAAIALVLSSTLTACTSQPDGEREPATSTTPAAVRHEPPADVSAAVSETREDSVYPEFGDPLVDALHYDLALAWTPESDHLEAIERLTFRATADAREITLDFHDALTIDSLTVDGDDVEFQQAEKDLTIARAVTADTRYLIELTYSGTPDSYPGPYDVPAFATGLGWVVTDEHETFTLPAPGAFTRFAVNDQPADKAFYDFTLTVPEPWTGVASGELVKTTDGDGLRTTEWHVAEPAHLVTVTFGDYSSKLLRSASGVPITVWFPSDDPAAMGEATFAPEAMDWLEQYLGPYPFDTLAVVIFGTDIGIETHAMVTLGEHTTSRPLVVHEVAHAWYGDAVSPADRSDAWMDEGWATYFHTLWEAENLGGPLDARMDRLAAEERVDRLSDGPPGDPHGTIYSGPALMWQELREDIGDDAFFDLARTWPEQKRYGTADRDEYFAWLEQETGLELTAFFDAWLLGQRMPDRRD
jgi:aminopeptidase N